MSQFESRLEQPPASRKRTRQSLVLTAAIRIIGERGFRDFSIQELAARCGVTNGGLLYHFKTKDDLFAAVLQEHARRLKDYQHVLAPRGVTGEADQFVLQRHAADALRAYLGRLIADEDFLRLHAMLQWEALDPEHPGHTLVHECACETLNHLGQLIAPFCATPGPSARRLDALMHGLCLQWLQSGRSFDLVEEWDLAAEHVLSPTRRAP